MMISFLTWNTGKKNNSFIADSLGKFQSEHQPSIIVLQECLSEYPNKILNDYDEVKYPNSIGLNRRVRIFLKKATFELITLKTGINNKLVFIRLKNKKEEFEFNVAAVHLYSLFKTTERQQLWKNKALLDLVESFEKTIAKDDTTILIGDLNYNPYDVNLSDPYLFNALENRHLISLLNTSPKSTPEKSFWYNPTWNLLGDYDYHKKIPRLSTGTYFYNSISEQPYWRLLDSALIRPKLMNKVNFEHTEIVTEINGKKLIKSYILGKNESIIIDEFSDHLPLKLTLNI